MNMKTILHVVKKMSMSLLITAVVIAISIAIMSVNQTAGIILMMLYSSFMVVKSSSKEMPLNTFTALLPGLMSLIIFLVMLGMIEVHNKLMPLIGIGLGIIPGWLMARAHKLYKKNGIVYAKRTFIYIIIWVLSLLFTQGSTLAGIREITDFGFLLNGFSTAMMVVLSLILYRKNNSYKYSIKNNPVYNVVFTLIFVSGAMMITPTSGFTYSNNEKDLMRKVGKYVFSSKLTSTMSKLCKVTTNSDCKLREPSYDQSLADGFYSTSFSLPNQNGLGMQTVFFTLVDTQNNNSWNRTWVQSNCPNDGEYRETKIDEGLAKICKVDNVKSKRYALWFTWRYNRWIVRLHYDYYKAVGNLPDTAVKNFIAFSIDHIIKKIKSIKLTERQNSTQDGSSNERVVPQEENHQDDYQHNSHMHSHIDSSPAFSDNEITAGAAAALLMLLGSLSLNAAMLVAQGVAQGTVQTAENTAFGGASYVTEEDKDASVDDRESNRDGFVRGTRILDGAEAEEWMMNHGYIINGQPTSRYTDFINSMPTDRAEGLQGIAGEMDEEGNPIGDYVIIVDDENINISQIDDSLNHEPSEEQNNPDEADSSNFATENNNEDNIEHEENTASNYATTETSENNSDESSIDTSAQNSTASTQETTLDEPEKEIPSVDYSHAREDLESIMDNLIKDKIKDKYYVRNPDFISNIFNNYPGWIIYEKFGDYKGGQCGEYAAWGVEWSKDAIRDRFGKNVKFELISVRSNFWSKIDHGATRVTLPNGEKYVLDFWEGIQDEKPHVYTENEWVQKNQDKYNIAGQGTKLEYNPSQDMLDKEWRDKHERILNNFIKNLGEEEGKKRFLEQVQKQDRNDLGDAEDIIKNWEVNHDTK